MDTHWKITRASLLAIGVAAALCSGPAVDRAEAGCTNYEDYLHWIGEMVLPICVVDVCVQGDYEYIAGYDAAGSYLQIADITNESAPVIVGSIEVPISVQDVTVSGTIAAVCAVSVGVDALTLVDVSDPSDPQIMSSSLPGYFGKDVLIDETALYMTCSNSPEYGIVSVDISDPTSPAVRDSIALDGVTDGIILRGDYLYIGTGDLVTINVANPDSIFVADLDDYYNRGVVDIALNEDHIFVSTRHVTEPAQIAAVSLADPANPLPLNGINTAYAGGAYYPDIAAAADICYYGTSTGGIWRFDVSNPTSIQELDYLPHTGHPLRELTVCGPNLYYISNDTAAYTGYINVYSVSSPSPLEPIGSVDTPGDALDVAVAPGRVDLAYVADGASGVQIVDITDPLDPFIVDTVDTPGTATEIELVGTLAYVADGEAGLQVIEVTTREIIGSVDTPGNAVDLAVAGDFVYMADSSEGLRVIDITIPSAPFLRGVEDALLDVRGVDVYGSVAYVADGDQGLQSINVDDPDDPWIIDGVKNREVAHATKVDVVFDRVYVTDQLLGLVVVDATDPADLQIVSDLGTDGTPGDVSVLGLFAFVGSGAGMRLIDVQDDANPVMVGGVNVPATARGIFANANYAYVAAGSAGLQVCPTQCGFDEVIVPGFAPMPPADFYPVTVAFNNECIGYGMSYTWDFGDSIGTSTETSPSYTYTEPGDYTVTLEVTNGTNTEVVSEVVSALAEPPTLTSVVDVPGDEGRYVYVDFYFSGYDDGDLNRVEMYTIQRLDGTQWVTVGTVGAYGEHYYTAEVRTLGDGIEWLTQFRVIAHMEEGNWVSEPMAGFSLDNTGTGVPDTITEVQLLHARPNPFNPTTEIGYALPVSGPVRLCVYDVSGRVVRTLVDKDMPAGRHAATWSGRDDAANEVASGVYFYQLDAGDRTLRRTMTLLK